MLTKSVQETFNPRKFTVGRDRCIAGIYCGKKYLQITIFLIDDSNVWNVCFLLNALDLWIVYCGILKELHSSAEPQMLSITQHDNIASVVVTSPLIITDNIEFYISDHHNINYYYICIIRD